MLQPDKTDMSISVIAMYILNYCYTVDVAARQDGRVYFSDCDVYFKLLLDAAARQDGHVYFSDCDVYFKLLLDVAARQDGRVYFSDCNVYFKLLLHCRCCSQTRRTCLFQ